MTSPTDNLVLEHLRAIRAEIADLSGKMDDLIHRTGRMETDMAQLHVAIAEHSVRFDRVVVRLDRIDKRLELSSV